MIDEEATFKKYGYYGRDLKQQSVKGVIAVCDDCGKIREVRKDGYCALCQSCAKKSNKNPMFGLHLTDETKKKMGESTKGKKHHFFGKHPSLATLKKQRDSHKGKNPSEETRRKISLITKGENNPYFGKHHSKEVRKKMSDAKKGKYIGENSPSWRGGGSIKYCYKWNEIFREHIRNKFERKCFLCGKSEKENGQRLSVHHVNYQKSCGCAETEEDRKADDKACQFVPLCVSCHSKVHHDRDKWERYFMAKMRNKLNGWYI